VHDTKRLAATTIGFSENIRKNFLFPFKGLVAIYFQCGFKELESIKKVAYLDLM
jgi:hypothetical protein